MNKNFILFSDKKFVLAHNLAHLIDEGLQITRRKFGKGAIATVYKGVFQEKDVAVKMYDMDPDDLAHLSDFYEESRILLEHRCRHIVKCIGVFVDEDNADYGIVMEKAGIFIRLRDGTTKQLTSLRSLLDLLGDQFPYPLGLKALNHVSHVFFKILSN